MTLDPIESLEFFLTQISIFISQLCKQSLLNIINQISFMLKILENGSVFKTKTTLFICTNRTLSTVLLFT